MDSAFLYPDARGLPRDGRGRPRRPQWTGGFSNVLRVWRTHGGQMMHVAKENLAGQGHNTHAVGRNLGLWTAEHAIVKDAVMQAESEDMRAQLANQAKTTATA